MPAVPLAPELPALSVPPVPAVALPFAVYGGVAADSPAAATALEDEAQALAQKLGVGHLELRNLAPRHPDWPTQDLYVTFRKRMLPDVEETCAEVAGAITPRVGGVGPTTVAMLFRNAVAAAERANP